MSAIDDDGVTPNSSVRFLVGDAIEPYQLSDAEIAFSLAQSGDDTYTAAALCARALSAFYARRVDTRFEGIESKYGQLQASYERLARNLESQAKRRGGLGLPYAGGISKGDVETARANDDRVDSFFYDNMFSYPADSDDR